MKCKKCGNELLENEKFCLKCSEKLVQELTFGKYWKSATIQKEKKKGIENITLGGVPYKVIGTAEPIQWIVLKQTEKHMLLLSKYLLDWHCYHDNDNERIYWNNSSIRSWLNNEFYNLAFNDEEKSKIVNYAIKHKDYYVDYEVRDNVFLLSESEIDLLMSCEQKVAYRTEYASLRDYISPEERKWWIRTDGKFGRAYCIDENGKIENYTFNGSNAMYENINVRPAIWVKRGSQDL